MLLLGVAARRGDRMNDSKTRTMSIAELEPPDHTILPAPLEVVCVCVDTVP